MEVLALTASYGRLAWSGRRDIVVLNEYYCCVEGVLVSCSNTPREVNTPRGGKTPIVVIVVVIFLGYFNIVFSVFSKSHPRT